MRTLHLGLRVADPERSIAFYTSLGYEVLGDVPATELGALTMLKLPGDDSWPSSSSTTPPTTEVEPGGLSHFVIKVEDMHATVAQLAGARSPGGRAWIARRLRGLLDGMGYRP